MTTERTKNALSGYSFLIAGIALVLATVLAFVRTVQAVNLWWLLAPLALLLAAVFCLAGLFVVNPNDARVLVLFGTYKGTVKTNGFRWANPFYAKRRITLRARNLNGEKLKVNDKAGNPIQIAAVVVWQVEDTFRACFDVDAYEQYVVVQSEAAVRHLAGTYPYDTFEDHSEETMTLRGGTDHVNAQLERELADRFQRAG